MKEKREKYAKNFKLKEKNKLIWKKQQEKNQTKKQELLALASKGLNINGKKEEEEDEVIEKSDAKCRFCRKQYDILSILKHIGNSEPCKIYYGSEFEEWKKEQRMLNKRFHRKEFGTKKELEQQRKRYTSEPKVRENKKFHYKEDTKRRKNLELVEKHQENCQRLAKISRERNLKGLKWLQDSFEKVFKEFKNLNNETKEIIFTLEKKIKDKFERIDSEINFFCTDGFFSLGQQNCPIIFPKSSYHSVLQA